MARRGGLGLSGALLGGGRGSGRGSRCLCGGLAWAGVLWCLNLCCGLLALCLCTRSRGSWLFGGCFSGEIGVFRRRVGRWRGLGGGLLFCPWLWWIGSRTC